VPVKALLIRIVVLIAALLAGETVAAYLVSEDDRAETAPGTAVRVSSGAIRAGDAIPRPQGKVVLRVRGGARGGEGRTTALDLATLERLPRVRLTVAEPFRKRDMTFEGVPVGELLSIAGAPTGATRLYLHALDDYHVTLPLRGLAGSGAILATRAEGRAIPIEEGGPVRLMFPARAELGTNTDNWIWSVDWLRPLP
jgi:hypothetical protein